MQKRKALADLHGLYQPNARSWLTGSEGISDPACPTELSLQIPLDLGAKSLDQLAAALDPEGHKGCEGWGSYFWEALLGSMETPEAALQTLKREAEGLP